MRDIPIRTVGVLWVALHSIPLLAQGPIELDWVVRHEQPMNSPYQANAMAVDSQGNVYLTDIEAVVKYSPDGRQIWATSPQSPVINFGLRPALRLAPDGTVTVAGVSLSPDTPGGNRNGMVTLDAEGRYLAAVPFSGPPIELTLPHFWAITGRGNVYFVSRSGQVSTYDAGGLLRWSARHVTPGTSITETAAVVVDDWENVFLTGQSVGPPDQIDIETSKIDAQGKLVWISRFNARADSRDYPGLLKVDAGGNVYVTTFSLSGGIRYDTRGLLKYDPSGNQLWRASLRGSPSDLIADASGSLLVTGSFGTARYDREGKPLWLAPDVPGTCLATDSDGYVYVAGSTETTLNSLGQFESEIHLAEFAPDGTRLWRTSHHKANRDNVSFSALIVSRSGEIVVGGKAASWDYLLLKYVQRPVEGLPGIIAAPQDLTVTGGRNASFQVSANRLEPLAYQWHCVTDADPTSRVLLGETNSSLVLTNVGFTRSGYYWVEVTNPRGTVASRAARLTVNVPPSIDTQPYARSVRVGGTTYLEVAATGTPPLSYQWRLEGVELPGATEPVLVITNAQLRQAGVYEAVVTNPFGSVAKRVGSVSVGTQLEPVWRRRAAIGLPFFSTPLDGGIAADPAGGLYATGNAGTIKFDSDGNELWRTEAFGGQAIAMQGDGQVLITGPNGTARLESNGQLLWSDRSIIGAAIGADTSGNFFVAQPPSSVPMDTNWVTSKHDASGKLLWQARYDGGPRQRELPRPLAVDREGAVVVVGGPSWNFVTLKFSPSGGLLWSASFQERLSGSATGVAVDGLGNVYVAGVPYGVIFELRPGHGEVVKYDAFGNLLWVVTPVSDLRMWSTSLAVGSDGSVYGTCDHVGSFKLDPNGAEIWKVKEGGKSIAVNQRDGVYLMLRDGTILKYLEDRMPPSIVTPPVGQLVSLGGTASLTATVSGAQPLSYHWRHDGVLMPGATNVSLTLTSFGPALSGDYALQVSNSWGVVISPEAVVLLDKRLLTSPTIPNTGEFRVKLSGTPSVPYRIEASTDLNSWKLLTNVFAAGAPLELRLPRPPVFTNRFFRAIESDSAGKDRFEKP